MGESEGADLIGTLGGRGGIGVGVTTGEGGNGSLFFGERDQSGRLCSDRDHAGGVGGFELEEMIPDGSSFTGEVLKFFPDAKVDGLLVGRDLDDPADVFSAIALEKFFDDRGANTIAEDGSSAPQLESKPTTLVDWKGADFSFATRAESGAGVGKRS